MPAISSCNVMCPLVWMRISKIPKDQRSITLASNGKLIQSYSGINQMFKLTYINISTGSFIHSFIWSLTHHSFIFCSSGITLLQARSSVNSVDTLSLQWSILDHYQQIFIVKHISLYSRTFIPPKAYSTKGEISCVVLKSGIVGVVQGEVGAAQVGGELTESKDRVSQFLTSPPGDHVPSFLDLGEAMEALSSSNNRKPNSTGVGID